MGILILTYFLIGSLFSLFYIISANTYYKSKYNDSEPLLLGTYFVGLLITFLWPIAADIAFSYCGQLMEDNNG